MSKRSISPLKQFQQPSGGEEEEEDSFPIQRLTLQSNKQTKKMENGRKKPVFFSKVCSSRYILLASLGYSEITDNAIDN